MSGAQDREVGCTDPVVPMLPGVSLPQSLPQDLPESAGPAGGFASSLRQQHFARLRQQPDEVAVASDRAASGAREANASSATRHAATPARTKLKVSSLPSIPWERSIPRTRTADRVIPSQRPAQRPA